MKFAISFLVISVLAISIEGFFIMSKSGGGGFGNAVVKSGSAVSGKAGGKDFSMIIG